MILKDDNTSINTDVAPCKGGGQQITREVFSVCFKCKIRFKTYGIHHNIKYGPKISLSYGTKRGRGSSDPLVVKDYEKRAFI